MADHLLLSHFNTAISILFLQHLCLFWKSHFFCMHNTALSIQSGWGIFPSQLHVWFKHTAPKLPKRYFRVGIPRIPLTHEILNQNFIPVVKPRYHFGNLVKGVAFRYPLSFQGAVFYRSPFKVVKCNVKCFTSHPFGLELLRQYLQPHGHLAFSHYLNLMHWSGASALAAGGPLLVRVSTVLRNILSDATICRIQQIKSGRSRTLLCSA